MVIKIIFLCAKHKAHYRMKINFQKTLREEFEKFTLLQEAKFPKEEILKIDLHCHDLNSDVPDELIGRILNVPETWLSSKMYSYEITLLPTLPVQVF